MINTQLPFNIACDIYHGNKTDQLIHEDEYKLIQNASNDRKNEFITGRGCAHNAIKKLGVNTKHPILKGNFNEPLWPNNITGSITHCPGYTAAAVAFKKHITGIGIDAELNTTLPLELFDSILTENEISNYSNINDFKYHVPKLIFSAKESFFKFIFPTINAYIKFSDVETKINFKDYCFEIKFINKKYSQKIIQSSFSGTFTYNQSHIVTSVFSKDSIT